MKRYAYVLVAVAISATLFTSCKKGDVGPPGTANVKFSAWFTPSPYKKDTVFGIWGYNYTKDAPEITQAILDSGSVLTYAKLTGYNVSIWPTNQVSQMPVTVTYVSSSVTQKDQWTALATPQKLRIRFENDHNYWTSISTSHSFRYIIIPGSVMTGRSAPPTYSEICAKYNIPE
jgi:hypothetical protein